MNRTRQEVAALNQALGIEILKEILRSLRITKENISEESNRATDDAKHQAIRICLEHRY